MKPLHCHLRAKCGYLGHCLGGLLGGLFLLTGCWQEVRYEPSAESSRQSGPQSAAATSQDASNVSADYDNVRNVTVVDTTIERYRGSFQLLCTGDVTLSNVTVLECGDFGYDLSAGKRGKVVMRNCRSDVSYNPVFNLTRGDVPYQATFELTILSPPEGAPVTPRSGLGVIAGDGCSFTIHNGLTRPLLETAAQLLCGGRKGLVNSTVINETPIKLLLDKGVKNCAIRSVGLVEDQGSGNRVERMHL